MIRSNRNCAILSLAIAIAISLSYKNSLLPKIEIPIDIQNIAFSK